MAFNQGGWPTIAVDNKATAPLGVDLDKLVSVMQKYVNNFVGPAWGAKAIVKKASDVAKNTKNVWPFLLLDDADQANALGYHDVTPDGMPVTKCFVKTTDADGQIPSVTATHELAEMLCDSACSLAVTGPNNTFYAYEVCDAVENDTFLIDGVTVSNFVFPSYFEGFRAVGSTKFDHLGLLKGPFTLRPGGYMPIFAGGQWTQIFGSEEKQASFAKEDRRDHRTEIRSEGRMIKVAESELGPDSPHAKCVKRVKKQAEKDLKKIVDKAVKDAKKPKPIII